MLSSEAALRGARQVRTRFNSRTSAGSLWGVRLSIAWCAQCLFSIAPVSAFEIEHRIREEKAVYSAGDTVVVDLFLDADPNLSRFSVAVLGESKALSYDAASSAQLPIKYPAPAPAYGTTGARPAYILYGGGKPATLLRPHPEAQKAFRVWPKPVPGKLQVNIQFAEPNGRSATAGGREVWIASLFFKLVEPAADTKIHLSLSADGTGFETRSGTDPPIDIASEVKLAPPLVLKSAPVCSCAAELCVHWICEAGSEASCDDSFDNDGDASVDCEDSDCKRKSECRGAPR